MMGEALSNREVHEEKEVALSISSSVVRFDDLSRQVVDCAYKVHQYFGAGLMEKIYEEALCKELFKWTYMKISRIETGFIINFKEPYFKNAIKRFALTSKTS